MVLNKVGCHLDTIHITITRPRNIIGFVGENGEPTDKPFYGILEILAGKNYEVQGGTKKFVNNGSNYVQSNQKEILTQIRSADLMEHGATKVRAIFDFLEKNGVKPKPKRSRKKDATKAERPTVFYQISRLDFAVDYETNFDLIKVLSDGIGHRRFFTGIQKDYFYRVTHENKRVSQGQRAHNIKEMKLGNQGVELAIYNKKLEVAEEATPKKLALYPEIYRDILIDKKRHLLRAELRFFRSRSIAFNHLTTDEIFNLPANELTKFGKATSLLKRKKQKTVKSLLFSRIFELNNTI